ncbi:MAG: hypothetical protein WA871_08690 [Candidatus Acidiferrales bacterium]
MAKTISFVESTGQGKIEIHFLTAVSYPFVDATEVIPDPDAN